MAETIREFTFEIHSQNAVRVTGTVELVGRNWVAKIDDFECTEENQVNAICGVIQKWTGAGAQ